MQVSLLSTIGGGPPADRSSLLLLPNLLKLMGADPQALREQREEEQQERREERHRQVLAAGGVGPPNPTELAVKAERKLVPGTRAARQQMWTDIRQQDTQRRAFQRTLADAAQRGSRPAGPAARGATEPASGASAKPAGSAQRPAQDGADDLRPARSSEPVRPNATGLQRSASAATSVGANANAAVGRLAEGLPFEAALPQRAVRPAATVRAVEGISQGRGTALGGGESSVASAGKPGAGGAKSPGGSLVTASAAGGPAAKSTVATGGATRAETAQVGKADANGERIVRVVRSQIGREHARVTLRLDPPELGTVRLQMDLHKDTLVLRIETHTPLAHRLLSEQIESLRQGLESTGIQLERVEVRPPTAADAHNADLPPEPDGRGAGQEGSAHADAEHPTDRGTEATPAEPADRPARETIPEPATESLVNILA